MARIGSMASEKISFENVDDGRTTTTDGRRMPAYIISSPMSLRLVTASNKLLGGLNRFYVCTTLYVLRLILSGTRLEYRARLSKVLVIVNTVLCLVRYLRTLTIGLRIPFFKLLRRMICLFVLRFYGPVNS